MSTEPLEQFVQYGCWKDAPEGWRNFDCSPYLLLNRMPIFGPWILRTVVPGWQPFPSSVRYGDIVKGLPVREGTCAAVYCSHVLEHLARDDVRKALLNTFRILAPGGVFRLVVPDIERLVHDYLKDDTVGAAEEFMTKSGLGVASRGRGLARMFRCAFGSSSHKWMWDYPALRAELQNAGFMDVRRAAYGDGCFDEFNIVERKDRWDGCLGIECIRPADQSVTQWIGSSNL